MALAAPARNGHNGLMRPHLLALAAELSRRGEPFALVTVGGAPGDALAVELAGNAGHGAAV